MRAVWPIALVALTLLALAAEAAAHPPTPIDQRGRAIGGATHRWLHQAKVPLPKGRVRIIRGACPGHPAFDACVITRRPQRIYMAVRLNQPRRLLYHELGHVFDLRVLNNGERRKFKKIMGIRRKGWFRRATPGGVACRRLCPLRVPDENSQAAAAESVRLPAQRPPAPPHLPADRKGGRATRQAAAAAEERAQGDRGRAASAARRAR